MWPTMMKKDPTFGEGYSRLFVNLIKDSFNSGKGGYADEETAMMMRSASQLAELPSSPPGQKSN